MRQNDFSIRIWAIIIGVRKCGTRALLAFCGLHPNIVHAGKYMFFFIASQSLERRSYQFIITSLRNYNRKCCNFFLWGSRYRTIVLLEILIFDMFKILVYLIQWRSKPRFDKLVVKSTMLQHLQFIPIWPIFPIFDCAGGAWPPPQNIPVWEPPTSYVFWPTHSELKKTCIVSE